MTLKPSNMGNYNDPNFPEMGNYYGPGLGNYGDPE